MATLAKTYGVTLVVKTATFQYGGSDTNQFFGGSSDRIAMLKFDAPAELASSEYMLDAILRIQARGEDAADSDNITIGLISGSWPGTTAGGYTAMKSYCNGPTITHYMATTLSLTEIQLDITDLLAEWAADPTLYSGVYLRKSSMSLVRVSASDCDITTTVAERTAPGAPTSAYLSGSVAENDPTLSVSGATNGTNNPIIGYEIEYAESENGSAWGSWTDLKTVTTSAASFSTTVALPSTRGHYRKYRVKTLGEYSIDSDWVDAGQCRKNSLPLAPTTVTASPTPYEAGGITLAWSGATDADNNIIKYHIQYALSDDGVTWGAWTDAPDWEPGPSVVYSPTVERGKYIKYRIRTVDAFYQYSTTYTESNAVRRNSAPSAPTIGAPGTSKTTYNPRPRLLVTIGSDADGQNQTVTASGYTASAPGAQAVGKKLILRRDAPAAAGTVSASVVSTDAQGVASSAAAKSLTYAEPSFTDAILSAGTTAMKAAHITELRTMINTVRDYYGLSAYSWAETITAGTTALSGWAAHVIELRAAINEIVTLVNGWDLSASYNRITPPAWIAVTSGQKPSAAVVEQIRAVLVTL